MDSITHIALGACIGDLFLGNKIGKKAMLYGAIAASLPDIDFIASFWLNEADDLLAHRGITHSLLFAACAVLAMAFIFRRRHRVEQVPIRVWLIFLGTEILSHLFLDAFNAYGIGWFEPFSSRRFSFHVIFVADPLFSLWPGLAALVLVFLRRYDKRRRGWAVTGLALSSLYLMYCVSNKVQIDRQVRQALVQQSIPYTRFFSTPTPFNNWLWYIVAETDSGYHIGYRSVFDKTDRISFRYFLRREALLQPVISNRNVQQLLRFSQGYYTAESSPRGLVFNDLRFGQIMGWEYPEGGFVFHFYLQDPQANHLVVQRGRFAHWNRQTLSVFIRRMRGN